jgi:serine/threonine protein kinase
MLTSQKKGTLLYLAPEAFLVESFAAKPLDVWAAGCTLYHFISGEIPFSNAGPMPDSSQGLSSSFIGKDDMIKHRICKTE